MGEFNKLKDKAVKQDIQVQSAYRSVFSGELGIMVLTDILMELGFADILTAPTEADTILQAAAKRILSKFGNWQPDRFRQIIAAIISVPPVVWPVKVTGEYGGAQAPKSPRVVKIGRAKDAKGSESERAGKPKGGRRKTGASGITTKRRQEEKKGEESGKDAGSSK